MAVGRDFPTAHEVSVRSRKKGILERNHASLGRSEVGECSASADKEKVGNRARNGMRFAAVERARQGECPRHKKVFEGSEAQASTTSLRC